MNRMYERGHDILENSHATSAFAFIAVLGYIAHRCARLADSGLYLRLSNLLAANSLHRFSKIGSSGRTFEECIFGVRTVLPVMEIGPARQHQLDQGTIAAQAVIDRFKDADDLDEGRSPIGSLICHAARTITRDAPTIRTGRTPVFRRRTEMLINTPAYTARAVAARCRARRA